MTRLRIKTADGKLERITVPDHSTLRELKEVIAKNLLCDTSTIPDKAVSEQKGAELMTPCAVCLVNFVRPASLGLVLD